MAESMFIVLLALLSTVGAGVVIWRSRSQCRRVIAFVAALIVLLCSTSYVTGKAVHGFERQQRMGYVFIPLHKILSGICLHADKEEWSLAKAQLDALHRNWRNICLSPDDPNLLQKWIDDVNSVYEAERAANPPVESD